MKLKLYAAIGFLMVISLMSCKTASKLYQKGEYDEAVALAAKKLQKDPNDAKLLDIIQNAYHYAVNDHEAQIANYAAGTNELKWEWMYSEYQTLQKMYDAIYKVPAVYELVNPTDYSSFITTYAGKAADTRVERGMSFMSQNDKQSFRNAYHEFQVAQSFQPNDRLIQEKLNDAYDAAVVNVIILPAAQSGFQFSSYNYTSGSFDDAIVRDLSNNSGNEFVRFYSSWDAQSQHIVADEVVDLQFSGMNIGGFHDSRTKREVSKEIVVKQIVYKPDSVVNVYGTVKAQITTTNRSMNSEGGLQVNISGGSGNWLWGDRISSDYSWSTTFATYTGDERALSDNDKQLVNRRQQTAPGDDEIVSCITNDLNAKLLYALRSHYSGM